MTDQPTPTNEPPTTIQPATSNPDGAPFVPGPWDATVAGKKIAWGLAQFHVAVLMAPTLAPRLADLIDKISGYTEPYGVSLSVDQAVFEKALPTLIFIVLVTLHDYAKIKTKLPWL